MAALIKEGDYAVHACEDGAMQLISLNRKRARMTDAPKSDVAETKGEEKVRDLNFG